MIFRETIQTDLKYMENHSINQKVDRKQLDRIDYIYTLEHEDIPLMVGGFRMITSSVAWCWIDLSDECGKHIIPAYRVISEWIGIFAKEHNIRRLQAFVRKDYLEGIRLMQHLGFEYESTMEDFFPDCHASMYKRLI